MRVVENELRNTGALSADRGFYWNVYQHKAGRSMKPAGTGPCRSGDGIDTVRQPYADVE